MTDFLGMDSRSRKLQQEQQKRREAAKLRIQREKKAKEAAARDQSKYDAQIRARKLEQRRLEEEARRQEEADRIRTGGIDYKEPLLPVAAGGEGDKVLLPPSALEALSSQDAVSLGPMLFELTSTMPVQLEGDDVGVTTASRTTHAGVLEFVADEGTIGLPRKVMQSLLVTSGQSGAEGPSEPHSVDAARDNGWEAFGRKGAGILGDGIIRVRYVRLAKATFARVVPETIGLSQMSELRAMLEQNLRNHATLTVGDRLSVWRRGKEFHLKVVELRPEAQVTLIDTDMELELDLPEEAREQLEEQGARDRGKTLRAHMDAKSSSGSASPVQSLSPTSKATGAGSAARGGGGGATGATGKDIFAMSDDGEDDSDLDLDDEQAKKESAFDPSKHRLSMLKQLPEEPPLGENGVFTCQLRSPGGKHTRRFRFEDGVGVLLDFAEAQGGIPGHYRIVVPFPRRVLTRDEAALGMTLREAGLTSKQESVILERV